MHIIDAPELDGLRAMRDAWMRGEITTEVYQACYDTYIKRYETRQLCAAGDGRQATAMLNGVPYCSACWLKARSHV